MSALSATPLTPAGAASTVPVAPAAPAAHAAAAGAAGAQQPPLAVIDAAIMQAIADNDEERRDGLMATRAAVAIGEILGAPQTHAATPATVALSPTPGRTHTPARGLAFFCCAHCHEAGTTVCGALWRVSLKPERGDLYYLHGRCLDPYKVARGLRSVEGRLPLTDTRARLAGRARRFTPTAPAARIADRSIAP